MNQKLQYWENIKEKIKEKENILNSLKNDLRQLSKLLLIKIILNDLANISIYECKRNTHRIEECLFF